MSRSGRTHSKGFASSYRLVLLAVVVLGCFAGIGVRLVHLHVLDREHLVSYVDRARRSITIEQARRGDILDTRGDILATSRTQVTLAVDPWALVEYLDYEKDPVRRERLRLEEQQKREQLAALLQMPAAELERLYEPTFRGGEAGDESGTAEAGGTRNRWVKLRDDVDESVFTEVLKIAPRGLTHQRAYRRVYPRNQLASHLIGYVNREDTAAAGVERFADFYLRGQDGWRESEKDGLRRELAQFRSRVVPPTDGYSVMLSIDSYIQDIIEKEIDRVVDIFNPQKVTIIVSDPHTGFILGLANYPTFDLNQFNTAPLEHQKNVAITDLIEPGSTFKIIPASGALEQGLVTPATRLDTSPSHIDYRGKPRRMIPDDHPATRPMAVSEIIAQSSNKGATLLALRLGDDGLYQWARTFGFGEAAGFPFGGEINGLLNPPAKWSAIDITRIPAGYSVAVTPLQMHLAYSTVANGGLLMRPQIIREMHDANGETVYEFGPVVRRRVLSEKTARQMAQMLMAVVTEGTGKKIALPGYQLAGKTGTAQKLINGQFSNRNHVGSFVGFFPATRPRVAITVIVDDARVPTGGDGYGGVVAAPSFRRVAEQLIPYLDIKSVPEPGRDLLAMEGRRR